MEQLVVRLVEEGFVVRLLIGDRADRDTVDQLLAALGANGKLEGRVISDQVASLEDVMGQIARVDVVAAARYHNVVCALMLNKAVASFGYAEKNRAVMAEFGLGNYCQHVENLDVELVVCQIKELWSRRLALQPQFEAINRRLRERLEEQYRRLFGPVELPSSAGERGVQAKGSGL
jgi:polysaccharide pyruvyl transferase WcaK-like protein